MAMKDQFNYLAGRTAVPSAVVTAATAVNGTVLDRMGFNSVTFFTDVNFTGGTAGTKYTLSLKHGDDSAAMAAVVDTNDIIGPSAVVANSAPTQKIGYIGAKRYVQLVVTPDGAAATGNTVYGIAIMGSPDIMPTA